MYLTDFHFDLPEEQIAQFPSGERGADRLLLLDRESGMIEHHLVAALDSLIEPGTLMVFNDSRVRKARIYGTALDSGSEQEFLLLEEREAGLWRAMVKRAKRQRPGREYSFPGGVGGRIEALDGEFRLVRFEPAIDEAWLEAHGHMPLPPYIHRDDQNLDAERYQTVYAQSVGSAAAPTAGLHFTPELLARLDQKGIERHFVTLHVGLGTFLPVRTETIEEHTMHEESWTVSEETARAVNRAKAEGRPVLAVGTTSVRTLESAGSSGRLEAGSGRTSIFIYPGYRFKIVDRLFTNFHTPGSTLLMLVSAFAGREKILESYGAAVKEGYRFFSYGDAMYIR